MREENLAVEMSTIDPTSPIYEPTKKFSQELFQNYDLEYIIDRYEPIEISGDRSRVKITLTTKKLRGSLPFRNNTLISIYTMSKSNGKWKIYSSSVEQITYLN